MSCYFSHIVYIYLYILQRSRTGISQPDIAYSHTQGTRFRRSSYPSEGTQPIISPADRASDLSVIFSSRMIYKKVCKMVVGPTTESYFILLPPGTSVNGRIGNLFSLHTHTHIYIFTYQVGIARTHASIHTHT